MRPALLTQILQQELSSAINKQHTPVMIWGPPGVGKSAIIQNLGQQHNVPVIDIRLSQLEPSDLRGIPFKQEQWVEWAIPAMLPDAERHGPTGILFLDEITSAVPSVSAAAYQLILDRKLGDYRLPDGWAIFAAGNRQGDRGISYIMPAPLANRFSHYELEVYLDDWVAWAYRNGIDERIIGFLRFRPELLFEFDAQENPVAFPSPRSWQFAHHAIQKFGDNKPVLLHSLQACVGGHAGIELNAFIDSMDSLPDIDAILAGECFDCPEAIDLQYAVAATLINRAIAAQDLDPSTRLSVLDAILTYAKHMKQKEMGVMLVSDLARAIGEPLYEAPAFAQWAEDVGDIMLYH